MLPVYDWSPKNKTPGEILKILLKPPEDNTTCKAVPTNISHNVCFLLDASNLESQSDWKCDDMGSWKNNGVQRVELVLTPEQDVLPASVCVVEDDFQVHKLKRIYYKNNSSPDLKKIVSFLEGNVWQLHWEVFAQLHSKVEN